MRRRNDGPWRNEVMETFGSWCRCCKRNGDVQADHMRPRSQGGKSVVGNGLPLCDQCHRNKTEHRMLVRPEWLEPQHFTYLKESGWAWWDEAGEVYGEGRKSFARRVVRGK